MSNKPSIDEINRHHESKIQENFPNNPSELDKLACLAAVYFDIENYKTAIEKLTKVLEKDSDHVFALEYRGRAYRMEGGDCLRNAEADLNRAIKLGGNNLIRTLYRGDVYRKLGNYQAAVENFNWVIENHGNSGFRNIRRAHALSKLDQYEKALKDANIAFKLGEISGFAYHVRGFIHYKLHNLDEAVSDFSESFNFYKDNKFAYLYRGIAYLEMGKIQEAEDDLLKANQNLVITKVHLAILNKQKELVRDNFPDNPTEFDQLAALGAAYLDKDLKDFAIRVLSKVIELQSGHTFALERRGQAYCLQGKYEDAKEDFDNVLKINPESVYALDLRGYVNRHLGKFKDAEKDFTDSINNGGKSKFTLTQRGATYNSLGKYKEAQEDLDETVELGNPDIFTLNQRGLAYAKQKYFEWAILDFSEVIKKSPKDLFAIMHRGAVYIEIEEFDKAAADLKEALKIDSESEFAKEHLLKLEAIKRQKKYIEESNAQSQYDKQVWLGVAYIELGKYHKAIAEIDQVLEGYSNHRFALERRAHAYHLLGNDEQALKDINAAIGEGKGTQPNQFRLELRGEIYLQQENWADANDDFTLTLNLHDETAFSKTRRGYALLKMSRVHEALQDLNKSINELGDTTALAYNGLGLAYSATTDLSGNQKEALNAFTKAIEHHPKDIAAYINRGALYIGQDMLDEAKKDLEKAEQLDPKSQRLLQAKDLLAVKLAEAEKEDNLTEEDSLSSEGEKNKEDDHSHSSTEDDNDESSATLTLKMIQALYEVQQEAAAKQRQVAKVLYWVFAFTTLGLGDLIVYLIVEKALRKNDVIKLEDQDSDDATVKKGWTKEVVEKDDSKFDLYIYNEKAFKQAQALAREESKESVKEDLEDDFNSAVSSA